MKLRGSRPAVVVDDSDDWALRVRAATEGRRGVQAVERAHVIDVDNNAHMVTEDSRERDASAAQQRKRRNPFTGSSLGGRILSGSQLPWFLLFPPKDYGVLETTGRKSGQRRRCCLRIVHREDRACIVAIGGSGVGWLANLTNDPTVSIRIRGGWHKATATIGIDAVDDDLLSSYRESVGLFSYGEYLMWRPGRPTADGIKRLHATWIETGVPVALTLHD